MMTKKVGITGGIGTGKSFVSKIFKTLGVPFYDADLQAKIIMSESDSIRNDLVGAFGNEVYDQHGILNRKLLASKVFNNQEQLTVLNNIVHPVVIEAANKWADLQTTAYSLKEAALIFESSSYKSLDFTIVVTAPLELRIARVMERDAVTREEVMRRISKQMPEDEKIKMADFIIINDEITPLLPQIEKINRTIINK